MYAHDYVENDVWNQDPVELVCLLYSKAIEKLIVAKGHLEAGRIAERSRAIAHAMEVVIELQSTLDGEKGGRIAKDLARLYDYVQQRLAEANAEQRSEPLEEAIGLLSTLYDGWKQCRSQTMLEEVPAGTGPAAQAGAESGRAWTL